MTPDQFINKWQGVTLKERSAAQEHFLDLCRLLDEPTPAEADPNGTCYCFEKGAKKAGGGDPLRPRSGQGWADVWKRACFGMEYKGPGKDLQGAFKQLQIYTPALEYPPLLIVSDIQRIVIHTAFTGTVPDVHVLTLEDLRDAAKRRLLKWAFSDPERLRPAVRTADLTEDAAKRFGDLALTLRGRGHEPQAVARFCIRLLFCLFAEDIDLLPGHLFQKLLDSGHKRPDLLPRMLADLFGAMAGGGLVGVEPIDRFNGGLFDTPEALPLTADDIQALRSLAELNWSAIEPSIFGTLFERGLDPDKRAQLGAHYTDPGSILRIVRPVVLEPLQAEWSGHKAEIETLMAKAAAGRSPGARTKALQQAQAVQQGFLARLAHYRVLDPACGSGNFLYLALGGLKDLEHQVNLEAEALGLPRAFPMVGPENVLGIELNPYAAELARVTVWIGEIQWMLRHGFNVARDPILKPLDNIEQRDAVLNEDGSEPQWPPADAIVGNPPFLGDKKMLAALGDDYVTRLRRLYKGRVPGGADLVTYWFEKARGQIAAGQAGYAGLVATNSIRGGANRTVLERIQQTVTKPDLGASYDDHHLRHAATDGQTQSSGPPAGTGGGRGLGDQRGASGTGQEHLSGSHSGKDVRPATHRSDRAEMDDGGAAGGGDVAHFEGLFLGAPLHIFHAWSDEPWINDGAAVRVSLVAFAATAPGTCVRLDGQEVARIQSDLTPAHDASASGDLTAARALPENAGTAFNGNQKTGAFDVPGQLGRSWTSLPNPHGRPNSDVLKPWMNGLDLTRRPSDRWLIDFGPNLTVEAAALYEAPFAHVLAHVWPDRAKSRNVSLRTNWWRHERHRDDMLGRIEPLPRFMATARVAKHRVFGWIPRTVVPDCQLIVIARSDDTTFGILHSRFHELWALRMGTSLEDRPRYTPTTTFETFPFPGGLTPADTLGACDSRDGGGSPRGRSLRPWDTGHPWPKAAPGAAAEASRPQRGQDGRAPVLPPVAPERRAAALAIAEAAHRLNTLRENWLNPPEWVERVPDVVPGYPERIIPKPEHAAEIKKRTLTNLYNQRPAWLDHAHRALDTAVAAAYGWDDYTPAMADEEILRRLLALNLTRAAR